MTRWYRQIALLALVSVPLLGLLGLLWTRLARGDGYPQYSSMRSDPMGCRLVYETLREAGVPVQRNTRPLDLDPPDSDKTLLLLGASRLAVTDDQNRISTSLKLWVEQGGRLVISLYPSYVFDNQRSVFRELQRENRQNQRAELNRIGRNWEVTLSYEPVLDEGGDPPEGTAIGWISEIVFADLGPEWTVHLRRSGKPVLIERTLGQGSIVLLADTYPLSNQGFMQYRPFGLLATLLGDRPVVIDESHHLVQRRQALVQVMSSNGLGGLFLLFLLLGALYAWRSLQPLVPPAEPAMAGGRAEEGFGQRDALLRLLERSLDRQEVLRRLVEYWNHSCRLPDKLRLDRARRMEEELARITPKDPPEDFVRTYNTLEQLAHKGGPRDRT